MGMGRGCPEAQMLPIPLVAQSSPSPSADLLAGTDHLLCLAGGRPAWALPTSPGGRRPLPPFTDGGSHQLTCPGSFGQGNSQKWEARDWKTQHDSQHLRLLFLQGLMGPCCQGWYGAASRLSVSCGLGPRNSDTVCPTCSRSRAFQR